MPPLDVELLSYPLVDSGSMLIMTLAHARFSGDGSLIRKYVSRSNCCRKILTFGVVSSPEKMGRLPGF